MPSNHTKLIILSPVRNEKENILNTLKEIETQIKTPHEILILYGDDGDNTIPVLKNFLKKKPKSNLKLLKNHYKGGVAKVLLTGFEAANADYTAVIMADLSDDLLLVDKMVSLMDQGYDLISGSRYMKGGKQIGGPFFKKTLSRLAGITLNFLAGIPTHDATNSFRLYRTQRLKGIMIESIKGFEINLEILAKFFLNGYRITELPTTWKDRKKGKSSFKFLHWLPGYLKWYFVILKSHYIKAQKNL